MQHGKLIKFSDGRMVRAVHEEGTPSRLLFFVRDVELMTGEPDTIRFLYLRHLDSKLEVVDSKVTSGMNLRGAGHHFVSFDLLENLKRSDFCGKEAPEWLFDQIKPEIDAFVAKCCDFTELEPDTAVWKNYWETIGKPTEDAAYALSFSRLPKNKRPKPKASGESRALVQQPQLPLPAAKRHLMKPKPRLSAKLFDVIHKAAKMQAEVTSLNKSILDLKAQIPQEMHQAVDEYAAKLNVEARI